MYGWMKRKKKISNSIAWSLFILIYDLTALKIDSKCYCEIEYIAYKLKFILYSIKTSFNSINKQFCFKYQQNNYLREFYQTNQMIKWRQAYEFDWIFIIIRKYRQSNFCGHFLLFSSSLSPINFEYAVSGNFLCYHSNVGAHRTHMNLQLKGDQCYRAHRMPILFFFVVQIV